MACGAGRRHAWEESRWSGRGGWKTQSGGVLEPSQTRLAMRPAGMACGAGRRHAWEESRLSGRGAFLMKKTTSAVSWLSLKGPYRPRWA